MKYLLALSLAACSVDGVVLVVAEPVLEAGVQDAALDAAADAMIDAEVRLDAQPLVEAAVDAQAIGSCRIAGASEGFYESFPDGALDARWLVADGPQSFGMFRRENVAIVEGALVLTATPSAGAAIATRDLFASATYQVEGRLAEGAQLAVWWRRDDDADGAIDIAAPAAGDFARVRMRSRDAAGSSENAFLLEAPLNDGSNHILRFDRYTTDSPAVRFWVDDQPRWVTSEHLPTMRAGRMWIAVTGSGVVRIANAFVTPFGNDGDACRDGELRGPGLIP